MARARHALGIPSAKESQLAFLRSLYALGMMPNGPDLGHTFRGNRTALFPGTGNLSEVPGDAKSKAFLKRWATNWATDFMSDSIQFRVRFDPRPVIHDRRAIMPYREVPSDSTLAMRERIATEIACRLGIPKSLLIDGNTNYSSARFDRDLITSWTTIERSATEQFINHARRRLLQDIKRMAMLRYQIDFYLRHHKRLPGSARTTRLRKKRITVVQAFCYRYFKRHHWRYS